MKKKILIPLLLSSVMLFTAGCSSVERLKKDIQSETSGGLERTVKIVNIEGKVIKEYKGKFDVSANNERIKFVKDGKVHLIYRSETDMVIIEEN